MALLVEGSRLGRTKAGPSPLEEIPHIGLDSILSFRPKGWFNRHEKRTATLDVEILDSIFPEPRFAWPGKPLKQPAALTLMTNLPCASIETTVRRDPAGFSGSNVAGHLAEEMMRQSQETFRLLVQGVRDYAIFMLDPQGQVRTWNEGAERIKGFRACDIVGEHFSRFYTPEAIAAGHPSLGLEIATEQGRFEEEGWRVRKDGSRFWANVVITPLRDESGQLRGFAKVTRDITDRMLAESRLRLLSERLSLATGIAEVGVWEWDLASDTVIWDDTMFEIYGFSPVVPMNYEKWAAAVHPEDIPAFEEKLRSAVSENSRGTLEFRIMRADGSLRNVSAIYSVVFDERTNVTKLIGVNTDITERTNAELALRKSQAEMTHSAQHDSLTGLPNRILLNDRLTQAIILASRHRKRIAVLFLDLDGFKHVNDSLGHATGDKLLQSVARRLEGCVRTSDTVSRRGGDEFVVLLHEVDKLNDPATAGERILRAVSSVRSIDDCDIRVTTSIGISVYPNDGLDAQTLIENADSAMYQAKQNGRHRIQFFQPDAKNRAGVRRA